MTRKRTIKILRIVMPLVAVTSLIVFVPWVLVRAWMSPLPDTVQEQVDATAGYGFEGVVVYVDQTGAPPVSYTAGWKNTENRIPADPHALFKIASIGKLYEAVAITKLVGEKQLSLDKTLADYFPEFAGRIENAEQITLRMMVQHRSGLPNLTDTPDFWVNPPKNSREALERVMDLPADFEPNDKYAYSNTNYLLISELIEQVTGGKFRYIEEKILMPLGLNHTFGSMHEADTDDLMSGYYVGVAEDMKHADYGSMVATAEDVSIFLRALNDGSLFEEGEQEIYSSIYVYGHTGLIPGYQSIAKYHSDIDAVVIQFTNTTDFDGYNWTLSEIAYNRMVKILRKKSEAL